MNINSVNGKGTQAGQPGAVKATDSVSKNIQRQIAETQKRLQELSSNDDMSMEEKMKKRQELQKQIYDLQNQLRQHEIQVRRENQQAAKSGMDDMLGGKREATQQKDTVGISEAGMKAMISADSSMKQAQAQGKVATQLKGKAKVLSGEMKMDRPEIAEEKQEELAELEGKAMNAEAAQSTSLGKALREMEAASKEKTSSAGKTTENQKEEEEENLASDNPAQVQDEAAAATAMAGYKPVDVLL